MPGVGQRMAFDSTGHPMLHGSMNNPSAQFPRLFSGAELHSSELPGPTGSPAGIHGISTEEASSRPGHSAARASDSAANRTQGREKIQASFEQLTGWTLAFDESRTSYQKRSRHQLDATDATGRMVVDDLSVEIGPQKKALDRKMCQKLADAIGDTLNQLAQTRSDLRQAQLELATSTAASIPAEESARVENLLRSLVTAALEQFGFQSASLWIIDDNTLTLQQRMAAGKHFPSLVGQRDLDSARADVRAMTGNVIVMDDRASVAQWQAPVRCGSAICLPVSSLSNLYGTLWLVRDDSGAVSDREICLLEIIAGRIACEIERAALAQKINSDRAANSLPAPMESDRSGTEDDDSPDDDSPDDFSPDDFSPQTLPGDAGRLTGDVSFCDSDESIQPPFEGWNVQIANPLANSSTGGTICKRWTGYRVTTAESMMFLSVLTQGKQAVRIVGAIQNAFSAFCTLSVSPSTIIEGISRIVQQQFDQADGLALCCLEMDPLTGEYRWTAEGTGWGQLTSGDVPLTKYTGAAILHRNSALTLSVPDIRGIWQPMLVIGRPDRGRATHRS